MTFTHYLYSLPNDGNQLLYRKPQTHTHSQSYKKRRNKNSYLLFFVFMCDFMCMSKKKTRQNMCRLCSSDVLRIRVFTEGNAEIKTNHQTKEKKKWRKTKFVLAVGLTIFERILYMYTITTYACRLCLRCLCIVTPLHHIWLRLFDANNIPKYK